jgi:DNA-binding transcriptional LysR family regulator
VEKAYRGVQIVNDVAKDLAESRVGRLRLVCSPSLGLALVPQAIAAYRAGREGLRISLEILSQAELIEAVLTHQANLGISMFPSDDPGLATETLGTGRLVCIMPAGHPLAAKHQVTPADLAAYPLISYHRDTQQGRVVEDALSEAHVSHDIAIEVRFGHTACALVQAGAGIALADEFSVMGTTFPEVVQRPFAPARNFAVSILRDRLRPASRAAEGFIAALRRINAGR